MMERLPEVCSNFSYCSKHLIPKACSLDLCFLLQVRDGGQGFLVQVQVTFGNCVQEFQLLNHYIVVMF